MIYFISVSLSFSTAQRPCFYWYQLPIGSFLALLSNRKCRCPLALSLLYCGLIKMELVHWIPQNSACCRELISDILVKILGKKGKMTEKCFLDGRVIPIFTTWECNVPKERWLLLYIWTWALWNAKGPFILHCQIVSVECPTNYECMLVRCYRKLIWSLKFEIILRIDLQMALFSIWRSSIIYWCTFQTKSNTNQNQFRA